MFLLCFCKKNPQKTIRCFLGVRYPTCQLNHLGLKASESMEKAALSTSVTFDNMTDNSNHISLTGKDRQAMVEVIDHIVGNYLPHEDSHC